jgi:hypothetical protein
MAENDNSNGCIVWVIPLTIFAWVILAIAVSDILHKIGR